MLIHQTNFPPHPPTPDAHSMPSYLMGERETLAMWGPVAAHSHSGCGMLSFLSSPKCSCSAVSIHPSAGAAWRSPRSPRAIGGSIALPRGRNASSREERGKGAEKWGDSKSLWLTFRLCVGLTTQTSCPAAEKTLFAL